ncbi:AAA family ATPase [Variovorax guangxiensis]|uniref:GTP-binding protein n=1 Tax=Variovorax guangxiensis TaxID=1775474 RepID=A0A502DJF2_9BURK|nr:AAA family ATPase [Variovorax guangxiensis]TPG21378.1 GTP-binding protein [Variovorax ginsengisoli]TPG25428.1 GTP-binding protein [Variovorax guangxiensis]
MKLSRIKIEQVRQFRRPFELADLDPGLNLFTGPNEAGKSTVVRAIRAAFFERHRSSGVDDLIPYGDASASPTIEIDFETGAEQYRLRKTFFQRKRFNLSIGKRELDGEEAEQHLAQMLGFEFSSRGSSKPEHWGIPGLLWIEQGAGQDIKPSVGHATSHLRKALNQSVGEVASTQGDDVARKIEAERDQLLTQAGKPRGVYHEAITRQDALAVELRVLDEQIAAYRSHVDQLEQLQAADHLDQATKPSEAFQKSLDEAKLKLTEAQGLAARLESAREALKRHEEHVKLVQQQLKGYDDQDQARNAREASLAVAVERSRVAQAALQRWTIEKQTAVTAYGAATQAVAAAQQADWRNELVRRSAEARSGIESVTATLATAQAEEIQVAVQRMRVTENEIAEGAVAQLRDLHMRLRDLRIRQEVGSTRVQFAITSGGVTFDGELLAGEDERLVSSAAQIDIPNVGRITVIPGENDLAQLGRQEAELRAAFDLLALRNGVSSLEAAEAKELRRKQASADLKQAERAIKMLAPHGIGALKGRLAEHQTQLAESEKTIRELPTADGAAVKLLAAAQQDHGAARAHLDGVEANFSRTSAEVATALAQAEAAERERDAITALLTSAEHLEARRMSAQQLVDARALQARQSELVKGLEAEVNAARPDILAQDVQRYERTVAQSLRASSDRKSQIALLRGNLEALGAQGLEEARAELAARTEAAQRRCQEFALRAEALKLVHGLIDAKRREATQSLQAPLQGRVMHYLQLLFPGASLEISEDLSPGGLRRPGVGALAAFDTLSFGAREQMGLISRLAYADLLKAAGRPTLLILDDALVHSDEARLGQMKRVLFDASQRHQVLLFTCHPALWHDLGASSRQISARL